MADVAVPFTLLAVLTCTWNGVSVAGLQLVDLFLVIAVALITLDSLTGTRRLWVPRWVGIATFVILGLAVLHVFMPAPESYLSGRFTLLNVEAVLAQQDGTGGTILIAVRWSIAVIALPLVVAYLVRVSPALLGRVGFAWAFGAAISAAVGVADWFGVTNIGEQLIGGINIAGRQSGLASHANNLGFACVIAAPIAAHLFRRRPKTAVALLIALSAGAFATGSRGAQVGMVIALLASAIVLKIGRRAIWWTLLVGVVIVFAVAQYAPQVIGDAASLLRFDTVATGSSASDLGRDRLGEQARLDFMAYPLAGVGMGVLTAAHSVPLQLAAAGGLALILGMVIYWGGALRDAWRFRNLETGIGMAAGLSVVLWLTQAIVQNQLVDRYLYVPVAIIAGVAAIHHREC